MANLKSYIGLKFGMVTMIQDLGFGTNHLGRQYRLFKGECECGKVFKLFNHNLGKETSCGCYSRRPLKLIDIGRRFGRLIIQTLLDVNGRQRVRCLCDCGVEKVICASKLKSGLTKSCGCLSRVAEPTLNKIFGGYQRDAKNRGYAFELSKDQFRDIIGLDCIYCGAKPRLITVSGKCSDGGYFGNGIDRINNSIGYTLNNSAPCCTTCNRMKFAMTEVDFVTHARKITDYLEHNERP